MNKNAFVLILILLFTSNSYGWWSAGAGDTIPSTHRQISEKAIALIKQDNEEYPDIAKFSETIVGATSGPTDDELAHGKDDELHPDAGKYNGGPFKDWWDLFVLPSYKRTQFTGDLNAYYRIGSMAHLVQDQAVPAHAANIFHLNRIEVSHIGITSYIIPADELESWATNLTPVG